MSKVTDTKIKLFGKSIPLVVIVLAILLCCCVGILAMPNSQKEQTTTTEATSETTEKPVLTEKTEPAETPKPTDTPKATNTSEPTNTPKPTERPTATLSPEASLLRSIKEAIGESDRGVERITEFEVTDQVYVKFAIDDNFTEELIVAGAQLDTKSILETVAKSGITFDSVRIYGTFPMQDQFGNVEESEVVKVVYRIETIEKINWENFLHKNIYDIADTANIHPLFERD